MTNLERMRQAAASKGKPAAPIPPPTPPPKAKPASEKPEQVVYQCGHSVAVKHFLGVCCPACGNARKKAKAAARKAAKQAATAALPGKKLDFGGTESGRLPEGAMKALYWTGGKWVGTMTVPGMDAMATAEADSERECYHALHRAWMEWIKANGEK